MTDTLDFYYDYSSPYGYLASERIEAIAEKYNLQVKWRPMLLGAVFKISKQVPLLQVPLKSDYAMMDFSRSAREYKLTYEHPSTFPIGAVAASRATLWLRDHAEGVSNTTISGFVHETYRAYYVRGKDITQVDTLATIADSLGIDANLMRVALSDQSIKDALRDEVNSAIEQGIFGSPTMMIRGEKFWGHDRLEQLDRWLASGGW